MRYYVLRGREELAGGVPVELAGEADDVEDVSLWYDPGHLPRAWIVHRVDVVGPAERDDLADHLAPAQEWIHFL